jgi:high affinity Mn2+ porin
MTCRRIEFVLVIGFICGHPPVAVAAEDPERSTAQPMPEERFAIHGQVTYVEQETGSFKAPYRGPNSLSPRMGRETVDATLFIGARLWPGAEGWIVPEIDQGFGLDDTLGVAGFPSGEAYKVPDLQPGWGDRGRRGCC